ncbi:MAG: UDP-glucose 4-epimerase GalE [Cyanobium sp. ELA507]
MAKLLITGGAGFIGSHTTLLLLEAGHQVVVLDNFSNSSPEALQRVGRLAGATASSRLTIVEGDIRDPQALDHAFRSRPGSFDAVIHFAGLKAVAQSVDQPLLYWDVNVAGSQRLLAAMERHGCHTLVFSSSATVYGYPERIPIPETAALQPINPYGHTKAAVEQMLADLAAKLTGATGGDPCPWRLARLRYFNPVGAHPSGQIGENPLGPPNNLFPFVSQVAVGRRQKLQIFGGDWPTPDGTGIRDYIHVMDLAEGHLAALETLWNEAPQLMTLNLGSGHGHSVLEVVRAYEQASGRRVPFDMVPRRAGDAAQSVADPAEAERRLGWRVQRDLAAICRDGWNWQNQNPEGYGTGATTASSR